MVARVRSAARRFVHCGNNAARADALPPVHRFQSQRVVAWGELIRPAERQVGALTNAERILYVAAANEPGATARYSALWPPARSRRSSREAAVLIFATEVVARPCVACSDAIELSL